MTSDWRALLYPLGLLASLGFGLRFFIQWFQSERYKESKVTPLFWILSLSAHSLMTIHSAIQIQYPLALIQCLNAVIAYRNIDLMRHQKLTFKKQLLLLALAAFSITLFFTLQSLFTHNFEWMGSPHMPWDYSPSKPTSLMWHLIGLAGIFLFASRFWIQWWFAEKHLKSELNAVFWWISLFGATLSTLYFVKLGDIVNILSYATGLVPYIRNLMLLKKKAPFKNVSEKIFVFAGENSGDLIGASLLKTLIPAFPAHQFYGVGGPSMRKQAFELLLPMENFKVMGFSAVLKSLLKLYRSLKLIEKNILQERPEAVILIDYADFNMRLAKTLRKKGYRGKIIHYVCPSVWAWKKNRIQQLASTLDLLLAIYPFEPPYFEKTSLPVKYIGHPLAPYYTASNAETSIDSLNIHRLGLFPGSRAQEVLLNLPIQLKSAQLFFKNVNHARLFISSADVKYDALIRSIIEKIAPELLPYCTMIPSSDKESMFQSIDLAIAKSGTITLELAFRKIPTVVIYKVSAINYLIAKHLVKIKLPFYCIVNIVAGKEIFPEFIHRVIDPHKVSHALLKFSDCFTYSHCQKLCENIHQQLFRENSSDQVADEIKFLFKK